MITNLNKEFIQKWIEALRSGRYDQGRGALNRDNKFCCLGVVCDISDLGQWESPEDGFTIEYVVGINRDAAKLPISVMGLIGIDRAIQSHLIQMNDSGMSFKEIADYLEELINDY